MLQFLRRRTTLALALVSAGLAIGLASGAFATTPSSQDQPATPSSQSQYSAHDKIVPRLAIPQAPPPPGSIRSNLVNFDVIAAGGRTAEVRAGTVTFTFVSGWTQVTRPATGLYCLNGSGFNYPATVSVASRAGLNTPVFGYVEYDSFGANCPGVQVNTYQLT